MLEIAHLKHSATDIRCARCGTRFEVRRDVLCDPDRLLARKESIAEKHQRRCVQVLPRKQVVTRALMYPGSLAQLDVYWTEAMRTLNPQPLRRV